MPDSDAMTLSESVKFVRAARKGVVATTSTEGRPQAALVALAVTRAGEIVFDTKVSARKVANIEANPASHWSAAMMAYPSRSRATRQCCPVRSAIGTARST